VIAAAVATLGFWTYQLIWSTPQSLSAVTIESTPKLAAIKEEAQHQIADAEAKLNAAEAEQQRLKKEVERQAKAAADDETKRRGAEAEQQRLAAALSQSTPAATNRLFQIIRNMEVTGRDAGHANRALVISMDECEQKCTQSTSCKAFAFDKRWQAGTHYCYLYDRVELVPNSNFDSGVRK
jgi:chromosome segregation ATPase